MMEDTKKEAKKGSEDLVKRVIWVILANVILGFGISLLRLSGFGTDPYTCMNLGVSSHLPISYGTYQMLLNVLLFIPVFILDRKSFGLGALINMLLLGYIVDFCVTLFAILGVTIEGLAGSLALRVPLLVAGVLVVCLGIALYMACDLGAAPYDRISVIIENYSHGKLKFKWVRVCMDVLSTAIGLATGSVVGIGTVVVAFFTGPIVSFFRNTVAVRILGESVRSGET